jgi:hypothetical protein
MACVISYELDSSEELPESLHVQGSIHSCNEGFAEASKSKRIESGILSRVEKTSRFSKEGALIPLSIRLRKSTDIPRSSANCSWLNFLEDLIALRRKPNFSRRLDT